jgi:hypothetical protein
MMIDAIYDETRYLKIDMDNTTASELVACLTKAYEGKEMPELVNKLVFWIEEKSSEGVKP